MSKKRTMTNEQVARIVDREGLDYAVTAYMGSEDFEDRHLEMLWSRAREILDEITEILEKASPNDEV